MDKPLPLKRTKFYDKFGIGYNKHCMHCDDGPCIICQISNYAIIVLMILVAKSIVEEAIKGQKVKTEWLLLLNTNFMT